MDEGLNRAAKAYGESVRALHDNRSRFLVLSRLPLPGKDEFSCRFVTGPQDDFDGIVVIDGGRAGDVEAIVRRSKAFLLPLANLSEVSLPFADCQNRQGSILSRLHEAISELERILKGVTSLPAKIRASEDPETIAGPHLHPEQKA